MYVDLLGDREDVSRHLVRELAWGSGLGEAAAAQFLLLFEGDDCDPADEDLKDEDRFLAFGPLPGQLRLF